MPDPCPICAVLFLAACAVAAVLVLSALALQGDERLER